MRDRSGFIAIWRERNPLASHIARLAHWDRISQGSDGSRSISARTQPAGQAHTKAGASRKVGKFHCLLGAAGLC
jgi:hypothetical protein